MLISCDGSIIMADAVNPKQSVTVFTLLTHFKEQVTVRGQIEDTNVKEEPAEEQLARVPRWVYFAGGAIASAVFVSIYSSMYDILIWDWLKLLVVPASIVLGFYWY